MTVAALQQGHVEPYFLKGLGWHLPTQEPYFELRC